jgi:hypothetical protein
MAEIYWPLSDDMPLEGFRWSLMENGEYARMEAGNIRAGEKALGTWIKYEGDYAMSLAVFNGLFMPWWEKRAALGGVGKGVMPFWLRDPMDMQPRRWVRQEGQPMDPVRDGVGLLVRLPLWGLPR